MDLEMPTQQGFINGMWIRGGTSNGLFALKDQIPVEERQMDDFLLEIFGSPDPLQINGIGGGKSHTSKFMEIGPSDREDVDVEYTYSQIAVKEPKIHRSGNCGNLTSAIGMAALLKGLVEPTDPLTELTLYNTNTDTVINQEVPIVKEEPAIYGDYSIDGVPGTGAKIRSHFQNPAGKVTGSLFPTENRSDTISVDGDQIEVSIIDATNVNVFVRAEDIGLTGVELPEQIENSAELNKLNAIRTIAADLAGYDGRPGIAFVSEPQSYESSVDQHVDASDIDITSRYISLQPHHAYAMTGAMALGTATQLDGTIPNEYYTPHSHTEGITIGHPKGDITVDVELGEDDYVKQITNFRTARPISESRVFYRHRALE